MKFVVFKDKTGKYRFRLVAANNKIVAQSEGYARKASAWRTIERIFFEFDEGGIEIEEKLDGEQSN